MRARVSLTAGWGLKLWAVLALVAVATGLVATTATACEEHQFRAVFDIAYVEKDSGDHVWSGVGQYWVDKKASDATVLARIHVTGKKLVIYVTITTTSTGDQIHYTGEMTRSDTHSEDWFGSYTITGGTGMFANASGTGTDGLRTDTYPGGCIGTICF